MRRLLVGVVLLVGCDPGPLEGVWHQADVPRALTLRSDASYQLDDLTPPHLLEAPGIDLGRWAATGALVVLTSRCGRPVVTGELDGDTLHIERASWVRAKVAGGDVHYIPAPAESCAP